MSAPGALAPESIADWLQLLAGLALFLAPGLAATDRLLGWANRGWWFAPVFSFSLMPVGAIVLDSILQVKVTPLATVLLAVGWTLLFGAHRLRSLRLRHLALAWSRRAAWRPRRPSWAAIGFVALLGFVFLVHSLPHWPGDDGSAWSAYPRFSERLVDAAQGETYPYPVHVDEHFHLSQQGAIDRQQTYDIDQPYTGESGANPLFSISGFRTERGFNLALVQLHHVTGMDLATQARFVPAAQTVVLAALMHATLAPAAGSRVSAAFVAIVPTTLRFLGPAFMVPSAFALPWILTALHVSLRMQGGRRLAALAIIETGGFFMHLVPGTLTLVAAALATMVRPDPLRIRLVLLAVTFLPMVWLGPLIAQDAVEAVGSEHELTFQPGIIWKAGVPVLVGAIGGAILAFAPRRREHAAHQVLTVMACAILVSLSLSIQADHRNDATYSRLIPTLFVCLAALAGLAVGLLAQHTARLAKQDALRVPVALVAGAVLLAPALDFHLDTPYYRVFDAESWRDGRTFGASNATTDDIFLSDPWLAPVYNAWTGARPHAVLYPGAAPVNGADWGFYLGSGGASQAWLEERSIDFVVSTVPPNAAYEPLGGDVYRILPGAA